MATKKSVLEMLSAATSVRALVVGALCVEDWDATVKEIQDKFPDSTLTDRGIEFDKNGGSQRFLMKPKLIRERVGKFIVKGAQYTFDWDSKTSGALVKDLRVGEDGTSLELSITDKGKIVYQGILNKIA
jgi:hypothetical protein